MPARLHIGIWVKWKANFNFPVHISYIVLLFISLPFFPPAFSSFSSLQGFSSFPFHCHLSLYFFPLCLFSPHLLVTSWTSAWAFLSPPQPFDAFGIILQGSVISFGLTFPALSLVSTGLLQKRKACLVCCVMESIEDSPLFPASSAAWPSHPRGSD